MEELNEIAKTFFTSCFCLAIEISEKEELSNREENFLNELEKIGDLFLKQQQENLLKY